MTQHAKHVPVAMTIAGSDSGGGAGIQADLKTFAALGVYGTSIITAITAQNTQIVAAIHEVPLEIIAAQIDTVIADIGIDVLKTGMLSSTAIIELVAERIGKYALDRIVVDPVMVAKGGDRLLQESAVEALQTMLIPLATIVTPNAPEAEALTGRKVASVADARQAAKTIVEELGAKCAVVKGGHLDGPAIDVFYDGREFHEFRAKRIQTTSTHGTGCTFASAVAAYLAHGYEPVEAVARAKRYVTQAILKAYPIGQGHGPLNHFYRLKEPQS
ncbi:MAG: bifunctional hydroxymethylpyrimidine kinase/phosphomethylpyrimidine kinase [Dehalococcoidia bacterium]|nr:bifunctional hydroxymethylpyrimidine kinase/phosphomethylpyrimidine kinase [Dehalococcoidia bacterium]